MAQQIEKTKLVLVEGLDEVNFVGALLRSIGITDIQVWDAQGKTKMNEALAAIKYAPGFDLVTSIGVIRDADDNPAGAFDSLKAGLRGAGYPVPEHLGVPRTQDGRTASVFILPGNGDAGMLETLIWRSIEAEQIAQEAGRFIDRCCEILPVEQEAEEIAVGPAGWRRPRNVEKARMQAFLSTMMETTSRVGLAVQKGYFCLDHASFQSLCEYLRTI